MQFLVISRIVLVQAGKNTKANQDYGSKLIGVLEGRLGMIGGAIFRVLATWAS